MSLRIRWQIEQQSGAFPLRNRPLHLLLSDESLDVLNEAPTGDQDGLSIGLPDGEGKMELKAYGALKFVTGDKSFRTVRLPIGGKVAVACGELRGQLHADGAPVVADPMIGKNLGGHKLLARLGAGAVGVVYRALQVDLDREVALKLLNAEATKMPLAVASFRREAQAAGRLSHPNLVQVYNVGKDDGFHYYTMELVPGGDFEGRLKEGPLPWDEAVAATRDCAAALAYAEEHGLVHRDVKPENLMIGAGGLIKLADLGLAATRGMLDKEAAGGTPHFMAPEAVGKGQARHQSDLYSLGCTLYRLLTGHTPFEGSSVKEILLAHRDEEPPTLKQAGVEVPRELEDLLAALLAKSPEDRPEHASEVVEELQELLSHQGGSRKALLLAVPILAFGVWGAMQAFGPKGEEKEPEKVVEYINMGGDNEAQAQLEAEKEKSSFFQAMAAAEGTSRTESLEAFLEQYPDGAHAEQAQAELIRLAELAEAEATANLPSAEEQARLAALEEASAQVRAALDANRFAEARRLVRSGELAAETEMLTLAAVVDQRANQQFADWQLQHQAALDSLDWQQAEDIAASFAAAIEGEVPEEWQLQSQQLGVALLAAKDAAKAEAFTSLRVAFQKQAGSPVREAVATLEIQQAHDLWKQAAETCGHDALQQMAEAQLPLFASAAAGASSMGQTIQAGDLTIVEAEAGRKAKVLGADAGGLKIEVQVSGSREERLQPWSVYQQPDHWLPLLQSLIPAESSDQIHALYVLAMWNDVATGFEKLGQSFNSSQAGLLLARLQKWQDQAPSSLAEDEAHMLILQTAMDLCRAALHEEDYQAFSRLQSLQNQFSLLSVWAGGGLSTWGLEP